VAIGITPGQRHHQLVTRRHADPPHARPRRSTPVGSKLGEATGQRSGAFQARQCDIHPDRRATRAGQRAAWGDTPCHGDVFHIQRQCESLANTLARLATGATSRRKALQAGIGRAGQRGPDSELVVQLELARYTEARASCLARDVRTLVQWLSHDVLALAGPALATRRELFDFVVAELAAREPEDARRIRPVRVALQNQRDTLLAFAGVLDAKLADVARAHAIPEPLVRGRACCTACPAPRPRIGKGGTGYARRPEASSTACSTP